MCRKLVPPALCTHCGPMILMTLSNDNLAIYMYRTAMCAEDYVAVALCTHCRPLMLGITQQHRSAMCADYYLAVALGRHYYRKVLGN